MNTDDLSEQLKHFFDNDQRRVGVHMAFLVRDDGTTSWEDFRGHTANGEAVTYVGGKFFCADNRELKIPPRLFSEVERWFSQLGKKARLETEPLTEKPEWVSIWAWEQYLAFEYPADSISARDIFTHLLRDSQCRGLWRSLERNAKSAAGRGLNETLACGDLAVQLHIYMVQPTGHRGIKAEDRRRSGNRIRKLAEELKLEIGKLLDEAGRLPFEIAMTLNLAADNLVDQMEIQIGETRSRDEHLSEGSKYRREDFEKACCIAFVKDTGLLALIRGGELWAASRPSIYRPGNSGASRQFFVTDLTRYFQQTYGKPMREACAAVTRSIYGDEIDAASVSQLAPVGRETIGEGGVEMTLRDMWAKRFIDLY